MPMLDIDLKNVNADNLRMTNHQIRAVMLYPDDTVKRKRHVALRQGEEFMHTLWRDSDNTSQGEFEWLTTIVPDLRNEKSEEFTKRFQHGLLAGGILATIKQLNDYGYPASKGRAIQIFERSREANEIVGPDFSASRGTINNVWKKFQSVLHFWAVFYLAKGKLISDWRAIDTSPETLLAFLSRAEQLREFGENYDPGYQEEGKTTLPKGKTWMVPEDIPLPDVQVSLPAPSDWLLTAYKKYKAPTAKHPSRD